MKNNMIGMGIVVALLAVVAGLTWLAQKIPVEFFLTQWPGVLIGLVISVLGMLVGGLVGRRTKDDE